MNVTLVVNGRFHHFHLARQLERHRLLDRIYTSYPNFKLRDEIDIPESKISCYPWWHSSYILGLRYGVGRISWLQREWTWRAKLALDKYVNKRVVKDSILVGLSGSASQSGITAQDLGGKFVCDRGSTHIRYQDRILREEYQRWGLKFTGVDPRVIEREEKEYAMCDRITVPSQHCASTFKKEGVDPQKIHVIPYGARLDRFRKVSSPNPARFQVLWVGAASVRKAFLDALHAFQNLRHPSKKFVVVGAVSGEMRRLLKTENLESVEFRGIVPNNELSFLYSSSDVFVLSSVEEGLALVQGEALACGCPVIATVNSGAPDLYRDGIEGYIVPIRRPDLIQSRLQQLAEDPMLRQSQSEACLRRVQGLGGWDHYGNLWRSLVEEIKSEA